LTAVTQHPAMQFLPETKNKTDPYQFSTKIKVFQENQTQYHSKPKLWLFLKTKPNKKNHSSHS